VNPNRGINKDISQGCHDIREIINMLENKDKRIVFMDDTGLTKSDMLVSDIEIPESIKNIEEVKKVVKVLGWTYWKLIGRWKF